MGLFRLGMETERAVPAVEMVATVRDRFPLRGEIGRSHRDTTREK
jgi:hypothetical protein